MTHLVVTADAEADTFEILNDLERKAGPTVAERYGQRFRGALSRLIEMPGSGSPRPALGPEARCVVIPPYIIIYDYISADDTLVVLRILHGRRRIGREARQRE